MEEAVGPPEAKRSRVKDSPEDNRDNQCVDLGGEDQDITVSHHGLAGPAPSSWLPSSAGSESQGGPSSVDSGLSGVKSKLWQKRQDKHITFKLSEMMTADENKCAFSSGSGAMTTDSTGSATPPHMDEEGELLAGGSGRNYAAYAGPKKICWPTNLNICFNRWKRESRWRDVRIIRGVGQGLETRHDREASLVAQVRSPSNCVVVHSLNSSYLELWGGAKTHEDCWKLFCPRAASFPPTLTG